MSDKTTRDHIVEAADQLFYQNGYEHTSFAAIAGAVGISRGNFYHHFKTKDEILDTVIALRITNTQHMLDDWESRSDRPEDRVRCFIQILITNWAKIKYFGCPVGTLTMELAKLQHSSHDAAAEIFTLFRTWLRKQFTAMGHKKNADELAMHVLAFSQGVATVASAFHDDKFVKQEVKKMCDWLSGYATAAST